VLRRVTTTLGVAIAGLAMVAMAAHPDLVRGGGAEAAAPRPTVPARSGVGGDGVPGDVGPSDGTTDSPVPVPVDVDGGSVAPSNPVDDRVTSPQRPAAVVSVTAWIATMQAAVNAERSAVGAAPVVFCARLTNVAQRYADLLSSSATFAHVGPDGSDVLQRDQAGSYVTAGMGVTVGENLARGQTSVPQVMADWMASPEHRAVLLDARFTQVGFGWAPGRPAAGGAPPVHPYWVQEFGSAGQC